MFEYNGASTGIHSPFSAHENDSRITIIEVEALPCTEKGGSYRMISECDLKVMPQIKSSCCSAFSFSFSLSHSTSLSFAARGFLHWKVSCCFESVHLTKLYERKKNICFLSLVDRLFTQLVVICPQPRQFRLACPFKADIYLTTHLRTLSRQTTSFQPFFPVLLLNYNVQLPRTVLPRPSPYL